MVFGNRGAQTAIALPDNDLFAPFDLRYPERYRVVNDGETAVGEPMILNDLGQAVQGWSLPVRGWPAGSYRLRVTVEDLLSGQVAAGLTVFSVRDGPQEAS